MYKTLATLHNYFRPYYFYIIVTVIIFIFAYTAYYSYNKYAKSAIDGQKYNDVANVIHVNRQCVFFHVDWCPIVSKRNPNGKNSSIVSR